MRVAGIEVTSLETLARAGAATRLHVVDHEQVWLDSDVGSPAGICIGVGDNRAEAIRDAIAELQDRMADLEALTKA